MPSLNPKGFQDIPLCELCFEDALKAGAKRSEELDRKDFFETSIRFCIDGLYKWLKSYSRSYGGPSVFAILRDISWWWASFCGTDPALSSLVRKYYALLKDITENTDYTDLTDRMDEPLRVKEVGRSSRHFTIIIPFECHGVIADCATALGMPFAVFYQLGVARALSVNRAGLFRAWATSKIDPFYDEVGTRIKTKMKALRRIENDKKFMDTDGSE
jgi:hypothetical protein